MNQSLPFAIPLIKKYEGFYANAYLCPAGYKTIGYGHKILPGEQIIEPLPEDKALELLAADAEISARAIKRLINRALMPEQEAALLSFTYNVGSAALQRSTLRRKVNAGRDSLVPKELMKWVRVKGRIMPGLVARRSEEGALYISGA